MRREQGVGAHQLETEEPTLADISEGPARPKDGRFFSGAVQSINLSPRSSHQHAENRPAKVTGRLHHPPDKETERSGGVWLIEGLRRGPINVFTLLEQTRYPRPCIGGR